MYTHMHSKQFWHPLANSEHQSQHMLEGSLLNNHTGASMLNDQTLTRLGLIKIKREWTGKLELLWFSSCSTTLSAIGWMPPRQDHSSIIPSKFTLSHHLFSNYAWLSVLAENCQFWLCELDLQSLTQDNVSDNWNIFILLKKMKVKNKLVHFDLVWESSVVCLIQ